MNALQRHTLAERTPHSDHRSENERLFQRRAILQCHGTVVGKRPRGEVLYGDFLTLAMDHRFPVSMSYFGYYIGQQCVITYTRIPNLVFLADPAGTGNLVFTFNFVLDDAVQQS